MKSNLFKRSNLLIFLGVLVIALGAGNAWWTWQVNHSPLDTVYNSPQELDSNQNALPLLQSETTPETPERPLARADDPSGFILPIHMMMEMPSTEDDVVITGLPPDRIVIPAINLDAPVVPIHFIHVVVSGTTYEQWIAPNHFAAGWHDSSAMLGLPGNTVLNGHHNAYGKVFQYLINIKIGDQIIVYSGSQAFEYQVAAKMLLPERFTSIEKRLDNARWIMPTDDERLTLITCWPANSNTHRVVIVAFPITIH
jgi:LPXTG-site transpeptidase (sortase) family protein